MTRPIIATLILVSLTLFVGCGGKERGPAYGQQQEFRRQIADSVPVKNWGYSISDVRLSDDAQKVLVVFTSPGGTNQAELVLENDGFRRYKGTFASAERTKAVMSVHDIAYAAYTSNLLAHARSGAGIVDAPPPFSADSFMSSCEAQIIVTLPDR